MKALFSEVVEKFSDIITTRKYPRGTMLHQQGTIGQQLYLVESGILRSFYFQSGKDITAHFAMEYGLVGAADSIIKGKSSRYNIEVLDDCKVHVMNYHAMETFLDRHTSFEKLARQMTQVLYIELVERLEDMTFLSARERYDHLLARYPGITQKVNLGHIASYLGITQETLSRIRASPRTI